MSSAAQQLERPRMRWKIIAQIALAFAVIWVLAALAVPYVGYWGLGVSAALTVAALGFALYAWRLTRKSAALVDILKDATDAEGRKSAIRKLEAQQNAGKKSDAMNALARAQLIANDNPQEAVAILEGIDLKKAPSVMQDDVRANLALVYLSLGRIRDARKLSDEIRIGRQTQAKAKAMYAAVMAESLARTGESEEARKLLDTYKADDPDYQEARPLLLRAKVYTYSGLKKRGVVRETMNELAAIDPRMLAAFTQKGTRPELVQYARTLLSKGGVIPKQKMRVRMR